MSTVGGFVIGLALAKQEKRSKEEQAKMGLVGALMPSPLLGAVVVEGLLKKKDHGTTASLSRSLSPPRGGRKRSASGGGRRKSASGGGRKTAATPTLSGGLTGGGAPTMSS